MRVSNDIELLIRAFPDKPWDWDELSKNPAITWEFIDEFIDKPWCFEYLSRHPDLTINIIIKYHDKEWDWNDLSIHPAITIDIIRKYKFPWNKLVIAKNPNITFDIVLDSPDIIWDYQVLSCNTNITIENVRAYPNKPWNWNNLAQNKNIAISDIDFTKITHYCNISRIDNWTTIIKHAHLWNWNYLSRYMPITADMLTHWHWNYATLSTNKSLTLDIVLANLDKPWNWKSLSINLPLTAADLRANMNLPWDWNLLARNSSLDISNEFADKVSLDEMAYNNPHVTIDFIKANPGIDWALLSYGHRLYQCDPHHLSDRDNHIWAMHNNAINWQFIRNNQQIHWDWNKLSSRQFKKYAPFRPTLLTLYYAKKWRHITRLKKCWRAAHYANFIHVLDHLKLYVRDKMTGNLRRQKMRSGFHPDILYNE